MVVRRALAWWSGGTVRMLSRLPLTVPALGTGNLHELSDEILERRSCMDHLDQSRIEPYGNGRDCARQLTR